MELPLPFLIRESTHDIHNPISEAKLDYLGDAIGLSEGATMLDLACGSGFVLCDWAYYYKLSGTGVDISAQFLAKANEFAEWRGVADRVRFVHADAAGYVAETPVDVAACIGATWIGGGVAGTVELLRRSLTGGGVILIGEPFWRRTPEDEETARECHAASVDEFKTLPGLLAQFGELGYDVVEMVIASQDDWDGYETRQWMNIRRWCAANPEHELHDRMRAELAAAPVRYARYTREYLGWGVFALMER